MCEAGEAIRTSRGSRLCSYAKISLYHVYAACSTDHRGTRISSFRAELFAPAPHSMTSGSMPIEKPCTRCKFVMVIPTGLGEIRSKFTFPYPRCQFLPFYALPTRHGRLAALPMCRFSTSAATVTGVYHRFGRRGAGDGSATPPANRR